MEIILIGNRREIRRWIRCQERITGKKIYFTGVMTKEGHCTYILQEGTKEDCPRLRTVRRHVEEEYPVFNDLNERR